MGTESPSSEVRLRQLEKAVENLQIGVTVTNVEGRIVYVNPADAEMHGYEVYELLGREARIYSPRELWRTTRKPSIREYRSWSRESVNVRKNGAQFPVLITSDAVFSESGDPIGVVTSCQVRVRWRLGLCAVLDIDVGRFKGDRASSHWMIKEDVGCPDLIVFALDAA